MSFNIFLEGQGYIYSISKKKKERKKKKILSKVFQNVLYLTRHSLNEVVHIEERPSVLPIFCINLVN
jgi:hypothetical protein